MPQRVKFQGPEWLASARQIGPTLGAVIQSQNRFSGLDPRLQTTDHDASADTRYSSHPAIGDTALGAGFEVLQDPLFGHDLRSCLQTKRCAHSP